MKDIWNSSFKVLILIGHFYSSFSESFNLNLIHLNDFHGNILPINSKNEPCTKSSGKCIGGLARLKYKIEELQKLTMNSITLNVGDIAQGTLWQTIFGWKAFSHFLNKINFTATAIGSHDFDQGVVELLNFLGQLKTPALCSNIDATAMPEFRTAYRNSTVVELSGRKIGLVGYIAKGTPSTTRTAPLKFYDELETVKEEAKMLHGQGVDIIIAMGHSGYAVDLEIAKIPHVDVVVGGKTHSFLYSGVPPSSDIPRGSYPTVIRKPDDSTALVVQAMSHSKYLGFLRMQFNTEGHVESWDGNPILLDSTVASDAHLVEEIEKWYRDMEDTVKQKVGSTRVLLDGRSSSCRIQECNVGNIVADAFAFTGVKNASEGEWSQISIAMTNGGAIQGSLDELEIETPIMLQNVYKILPYKNQIQIVEILGETLKDILEFGAAQFSPSNIDNLDGRFLQVSGLKMTIDICRPEGDRITKLSVLCNECRIPKYFPFDRSSVYRIAASDFLLAFQISNNVISEEYAIISEKFSGYSDAEAFVEYLNARGPLITGTERRIVVTGLEGCEKSVSAKDSNCLLFIIWLPFMVLLTI